ncbi:MAG: 3-oxoacyl-[acyl-carrier-protein] reductase [Anaerolineae bacterium]|nr:3-oxoacyl-[acyl-carrier-protein] reductase [Anaerolineae bacterium]MCO5190748.1 3-oxoacyl-[acyl-carrier-protein] reductase [Anaerolineae bacterium]MCO5197784.1 3-oxoacyl-[acyl-carrier-protein] reductase [Anaerolineae bacterium]
MLLDGKVALVTGASRGIGRAIAEDLAANGARVAVNYHSNAEAATVVIAAIEASGGTAIAIQADVSRYDEANRLIVETIKQFGHIDILVNNAGTTRDTLLMMMNEDQWDTVLDTNLKSVFNCCKAVVRPMVRRKQGGRIINITSVVGLMGQGGQTNYAASKAGIIGFTKSLAKEIGSRNITVNAIAPGFFPTDLTATLDDEMMKGIIDFTPLGRMGTPEEVAYMVTFLASDRAAFITGETIRIDGGLAM